MTKERVLIGSETEILQVGDSLQYKTESEVVDDEKCKK